MSFTTDQLEELKAFAREVSVGEEASIPYILLGSAKLPRICRPDVVDLLLCPVHKDGYETRLYFGAKPEGARTLNWGGSSVCILDRNWWVYSWRVPSGSSLRLAQMLAAHLKALG